MTASARLPARGILAGLGLGLLGVFILSILFGRYPAPYWIPLDLLGSDEMAQRLVWSLRLPRLVSALLLGAALATAGAVMQMIFRNPLVEPGFLGVTQGAAFGAALSILWIGSSLLVTQAVAMLFALLGLTFSYSLARHIRYGGWVLRLVLAGIAVSALFSSGVGVLKYLADPLTQLPEITFWLLGGLWGVTWRDTLYLLPVVLPGLLVIFLMRWRLNLLSLNDETAFSLGTAPGRERTVLLIAAVAATAAVTAVAGVVGWVGLIVPHLARRLCGANAQFTLPAAMLIGGIFAVVCDDLARALLPGEIPLGILTAFLGALLFLALMMRPAFAAPE
ncbi:MAG: iron ABC transporter permease [Anaerolineales bacterium]|nr:iron ABC transporter permease [Anaerolineales bacterium]